MSVSRDDVRHISRLARLALPDDQLDRCVEDLNGILVHMDVLAKVPTEPGSPSDAPGRASLAEAANAVMRDDEGEPIRLELPRESYAPLTQDGFFLVPLLETHDQAGA